VRDAIARTFLVDPDERSWQPAKFWIVVALASVSAAAWVALQPGRLADLHLVRTWLSYAQSHAADPYAHFEGQLDYPPIAFLVLRPLIWIPESQLALWFLPLSVVFGALAAWALVGAIADRVGHQLPASTRVALVAMTLSASAMRGAIWSGQTVELAVLFGALALLWSRRRPWAAGVMLALCSFKPHLATGFGLAILLIDGIGVVAIALAVVISASFLFAAAVDQPLTTILSSYARNLLLMYEGPTPITGMLSIRWVFDDIVRSHDRGSIIYLVVAPSALLLIAVAARRAADAAGRAQVLAAALIWPLLFLPSQLYNSVLAAPAIWLLMWPEGGLNLRHSTRISAIAALVMLGVLDVPRLLRFSGEWLDMYWLFYGSYYLNPLWLGGLFALMLYAALRHSRRREGLDSAA